MPTLRLTQHPAESNRFPIELRLERDRQLPMTVNVQVGLEFSAQDREDLRWYLEDYLQRPQDPAPQIAERVEQRLKAVGIDLFRQLFETDPKATKLWNLLSDSLNDTRVEIITGVQEATSIPWELLRDPMTDTPLALMARAFVRAPSNQAHSPELPQLAAGEKIRILLVICRPGRNADVPFRSVASHILKGLSDEARDRFDLQVLRPATFTRLSQVLREAKASGQPFHIVHFDGHGTYTDPQFGGFQISRLLYGDDRPGQHGYLVFEQPDLDINREMISGPKMGNLLAECDVPVLVLNACRSAHADAAPEPETPSDSPEADHAEGYSEVRAIGSLAQEIVEAGVAGVVAMRYNVYVVTAARFVADLYGALTHGQALGEAVSLGRKQLYADCRRTIAYDPIDLQDWPVPIVYEAAPIQLFPPRPVVEIGQLVIGQPVTDHQLPGDGLPQRPDAGFFGRDETLLALDRAFDTQSIVLLHAYAGSGKTTTAVEFARWYAQTGGLQGPVLFTSFETLKTLPQVLDVLGKMFEQALERSGIQWLALDNDQRRQVALMVMQQIPVLWIWDNVEPIAGFPTGTPSMWTDAELQELADFLRAARDTKAKFLLTSRRDERTWLGDLPTRLTLPPMPMQERVQLARALADKAGVRFTQQQDWRPLLEFTQGNPLTITVVVGQALREGITSKEQIKAFLSKLRAGETTFADEQTEGRSKSLGASLSYGFTTAFTENERKILALLHFFQGFVEVTALQWMGDPTDDWCLSEVRGLTRETGITLLDRAAEVGLLTAHGGGYYSIHPALPWYFKNLFDQYYPSRPPSPLGEGGREGVAATRAFVEALGALGDYYTEQYVNGNRDVIALLEREEDNLLHARRLARQYGWWRHVTSTMQGLRVLYDHLGRHAEWQTLVNEIVPDFVDPATDGPLPSREDQWSLVANYRVHLASEARQWAEAERLQRASVDWERRRAAPFLPSPTVGEGPGGEGQIQPAARNTVRTLASSFAQLGQIQREQGKAECVASYKEAADLLHRIGDRPAEAIAAFNLGRAYQGDIPALRDLDQAERWYRRALELEDPRDQKGRAADLGQLGLVAYERFKDARIAKHPDEEILRHLNDAVGLYQQALSLLPSNAVADLATVHNQLGNIYYDAGGLDRALPHWREAIRYDELGGNLYGAAQTRFNVANGLAEAGRLPDALLYAQAALRNFETYGDRAAADIQQTQELIAEIEAAMQRMKAEG